MSTLKMQDGTVIYYKDWGSGTPFVFSHGWPLSADAWDAQMLFLAAHGCRVIAHDRRGHGRSEQSSDGNTMDQYADDLAELIESLELADAVLVGHSTGGGEVARYIGRYGTSRVAHAVLISAVTPHMLQTEANPHGVPIEVFDQLRAGVQADRAAFFKDLAVPFFGYNLDGATPSQGVIDFFWLQGMMAGVKAEYECVEQFSATDFTDDLRKMDVPTLLIHGDADQIVPIAVASRKAIDILPDARLKEYPGAPHGLCVTLADAINEDLLGVVQTKS